MGKDKGNLDNWLAQEFSRLHFAYRAGNEGALADILYYCRKYEKLLPEWADLALHKKINNILTGEIHKNKGHGRHSKGIKQYKQDMIDMIRANTVQECREHGIKWTYTDPATSIYCIVSDLLKGTFAKGNEDAIEKSYKRFKKRIEKDPYRYMILSTIRLPDINLPVNSERLETLENIESLRRN